MAITIATSGALGLRKWWFASRQFRRSPIFQTLVEIGVIAAMAVRGQCHRFEPYAAVQKNLMNANARACWSEGASTGQHLTESSLAEAGAGGRSAGNRPSSEEAGLRQSGWVRLHLVYNNVTNMRLPASTAFAPSPKSSFTTIRRISGSSSTIKMRRPDNMRYSPQITVSIIRL